MFVRRKIKKKKKNCSSKTWLKKVFQNHLPKINVPVSLYMSQDSTKNLGKRRSNSLEPFWGTIKNIWKVSGFSFCIYVTLYSLKSTFTYNFTWFLQFYQVLLYCFIILFINFIILFFIILFIKWDREAGCSDQEHVTYY